MWIKKARAALSHPAFTGISRNHLDRLVAELADPFPAAREGRLHQRRGGRQRHRWPGAGHPETLTLRDRLLCTLVWLRLALPHQAIAVLYGVERSTVSKTIAQMRPLLANRGFATGSGQRLHTLTDLFAYACAEGLVVRLDGTEIQVRRPKAGSPGRRAFISGQEETEHDQSHPRVRRRRQAAVGGRDPPRPHARPDRSAYRRNCRSD